MKELLRGGGSLTGLQTLDLSNCMGLEELPEWMGSLAGLQTLNLSGCKNLRKLPEGMGSLTGLEELDLEGCNGLRSFLPAQLLDTASWMDVIKFLAALQQGKTLMDMVKIVLIGEGRAGKSSLLDSLEHGVPSTRDKDDRTVGIDIRRWMPDRKGSVVARVYDAAGQTVYRATHSLCISSGAMYVLVLSAAGSRTATVEEVWSWLEAVQVQAPGAFVAVVWTHLDLLSDDSKPDPESESESENENENKPMMDAKIEVMEQVAAEMFARMERDREQLSTLEDGMRGVLPLNDSWVSLRERRDGLLRERLGSVCDGLRYRGCPEDSEDEEASWSSGRTIFSDDEEGSSSDESRSGGGEVAASLRRQLKRLGRSSTLGMEDFHRKMVELEQQAVHALPEPERGRVGLLISEVAETRQRSVLHFRPLFCTGVSNKTGYGLNQLRRVFSEAVKDRELFPEIGTALPLSYGMLMHFAEGGRNVGEHQTGWERDVIKHVEERRGDTEKLVATEALRKLCAEPVVTLEDLRKAAARCDMEEGEINSAVRFLHTAGSVLLHRRTPDAEGKTVERVFLQPQWIVDAVKYVVREAKGKDVNKELREIDRQIRTRGVYGNVLEDLLQRGELSESFLRQCLWEIPTHKSGAAEGKRKFPDKTHDALLEVLRDFGLLRKCRESEHGERTFLVPAMLPERPLLLNCDISKSWLPNDAVQALKVLRRHFAMPALPGNFFSKLQLEWSLKDVGEEEHFLQEHVATFASRTASVLRRTAQQDRESAVEETVVVSMKRRKGAFSSEIRVMGWVNFIGAEETSSSSSVGSTSWSLFREVTAEIRKSARECGNVVERVPILDPETGVEICVFDPDGRELRGTAPFVRISKDPARVLQLRRDHIVPPADGRCVVLRNERQQAPSNEVPSRPVATDSGAEVAARVLVYCAQRRGDGIDVYSEAEKLKEIGQGKKLMFDIEPQTTFVDFHRTMMDACNREVRMVHFMGHGGEEGGLLWVKENNSRESVSVEPAFTADVMQESFSRNVEGGGGGTIEACVLNACSTIPLGEELRRRGLRHAVCWRGAVSDEVARQFSQWFYARLGANPGKYREAFKAGKIQVEVLQKGRLYDGGRKPAGSVCMLSEAGDIMPEEEEEEAWEGAHDGEQVAGEEPSGAPWGARNADEDGETRFLNNPKGRAELEAIEKLGFPLLLNGYKLTAGIRLFEANKLQEAQLGKYGLHALPARHGNKPIVGILPAAVKYLFADKKVASDAHITSYTSRHLWGDGGPLVRRSEHVTPAQRDQALQKLAESIKLREDQAKKFGGGDDGHNHMLDMLKASCQEHL
ncbi:hypothetical protein T484DRAFT_1800922 [Baffinella frigidus]|nr:hypothetical protein T484DRAFT_1800922 [Cryptophyta sp. CCMP2293]